ncbi:ankyrin repeat protein [Colletotrichum tofieldiae]|nr:ankyrin repeat protein [Colletotrichum tofieldiae]
MSFGYGVGDAIAILTEIKSVYDRFKEAPREFRSIKNVTEGLIIVLEDVETIRNSLNAAQQPKLNAAVRDCKDIYNDLNTLINDNSSLEKQPAMASSKEKLRVIWDRLRWDPRRISDLRLRMSSTVQFQELESTKENIGILRDAQDVREQEKILDWLTTTEYGPQQSDAYSRKQEGTGKWLLASDQFNKWTAEQGKTLLCPGMPGAGKTIMTSSVVKELYTRYRDDPNVCIAYIYCNFKDQDRQSAQDLLSSLAKQLVRRQASIPKTLKDIYDRHQKEKTTRSVQETLDILHATAALYARLFLVIDALDECNPTSLLQFLEGVFQLQQRHSASIFATSRDIPRIIESPQFESSLVLEIRAVDDDLRQYVDGRIPGMQAFIQGRHDLQELIRKGSINVSKGM